MTHIQCSLIHANSIDYKLSLAQCLHRSDKPITLFPKSFLATLRKLMCLFSFFFEPSYPVHMAYVRRLNRCLG